MSASTAGDALRIAGFAEADWQQCLAAEPDHPAAFTADCKRFSEFWTRAADLIAKLRKAEAERVGKGRGSSVAGADARRTCAFPAPARG